MTIPAKPWPHPVNAVLTLQLVSNALLILMSIFYAAIT
jgi:hypothetical protein